MKKQDFTAGGMPAKKGWLKKIGIAGFLFFLVKGLVWLVVAAWIAWRAA